MSKKITPVILCGGSGSRLWPASRESFPKQLISFNGEYSLFQETVLRISEKSFEPPVIVTNNEYRFLVAKQIQELGIQAEILLEPMRKDSCAAIAAAAFWIQQKSKDSLLLILAADHYIPNKEDFLDHVQRAQPAAEQGYIVTFGIHPSYPATGYGYIQSSVFLEHSHDVKMVVSFKEKPDRTIAESYLEQRYLWNSGNFLANGGVLLEELKTYVFDIYEPVKQATQKAMIDMDFIRLDKDEFSKARSLSIDYAIMEKTKKSAVIPSSFFWSDIGSWKALQAISKKDNDGNAFVGEAVFHDTQNSYIYSPEIITSIIGLDHVAVIATKDAVLVTSLNHTEEVKDVVNLLKKRGYPSATEHLVHYKPWGYAEQIDLGNHYKVQRVVVNRGKKISLQSHAHRSEHWIILSGKAHISVNGEERVLTANQSIYISSGVKHSLENKGEILLELIEVQAGDDLQDNDILRYEDEAFIL